MKEILIDKIFKRLTSFQTSHPILILSIAFALSFLSFYYAYKEMDFLTSQKDLISPKRRLMKLYKKFDQFDDLDKFIVVIHHRDKKKAVEFAKKLVSILKKQKDMYTDVFYRIDPNRFKKWALLYLDKEDLLNLETQLKDHKELIEDILRSPDLVHILEAINKEMSRKMIGELFTGFLEEEGKEQEKPMDLSFLINLLQDMLNWLDGNTEYLSPWSSLFSKKGLDEEEGYFWTEHKKYLLVFVTPKQSGEGFVSARHSLVALRKTISRLKRSYPGIEVGVTGPEALNMDEMYIALRDMSIATVISMTGLILLLCLFWRGIRRPILEMIELTVALAITTGLTTLIIGHLNILSVTFAPLLLGLGIDYGIHWLARYQEEINYTGLNKKEAIQKTMLRMGPGILLAGFTAALSFLPLVFTRFLGLVELGTITSIGMVLTTITTLCLLPSLVALFDKEKRKNYSSNSILLLGSKIRPVLKITERTAYLILSMGIVFTFFSIFSVKNIKFDLNMLNLQSKHAESVIWEKKLLAESKRSSMYGAIFVSSLDEIDEIEKKLKSLPTVSEVHSIKDLLPKNQKEKLKILRNIKPLIEDLKFSSFDSNKIELYRLDDVLKRIRFKMLPSAAKKWGADKPTEEQMQKVRDLIAEIRNKIYTENRDIVLVKLKSFENRLLKDLKDKFSLIKENLKTHEMKIQDLPASIKKRFISNDGMYLIRVFPSGNIWDPSFLERFVHDIRSIDPDAIGDPVTLYVFTKAFRDACVKAAAYAILFIFILLLFTLKDFVYSLLVMIPLILGTVWTMGLMDIFHVNFNLANSLFLPLIVGAGVEYGIIIIRRWRELKNQSIGDHVLFPFSTIKGVLLAGLTTTVGFGSLVISDHQGIYSLGLLAVIGSLCILLAAILFLPALLYIINRR